jgi:hypothetical protein
MPIEKTASTSPLTVAINGQAVDLVRQFTYLGSIISSNGTIDAEISARSAKANSVFGLLLRAVFTNRELVTLQEASKKKAILLLAKPTKSYCNTSRCLGNANLVV